MNLLSLLLLDFEMEITCITLIRKCQRKLKDLICLNLFSTASKNETSNHRRPT